MKIHSHLTSSTQIEKELDRLIDLCEGEKITLGHLLSDTGLHNRAIFTFALSLPFLLPIPLPGLSIPFGILIFWLSLRMFLGHRLWLPKFLKHKTFSAKSLKKIFELAKPVAHRLAKWVKPRGQFFFKYPGSKRLSYFLIALCGALLALPLPPGTNSPPAFTAALLSLGVLEEDSVYLLLGYLCFFLISILFVTLLIWGYPQVIRWFGY